MSSRNFGGDGCEFFCEQGDFALADDFGQRLNHALADDEAAAFAQVDVGQTPNGAPVDGARERLQLVQASGGKGAADDGADRSARDDVGFETGANQRAQDADMGPAARTASA